MRLRIDLAYDGGDFRGWASQPGLRTVQTELTTALTTVLRLPEDGTQVTCAGRTDSGVHARGQVVHVDVDPEVSKTAARQLTQLEVLARRLNGFLPRDVRVRRVTAAPDGFDARFAALWRRYAYRIVDDPARVDPLTRNHVLSWPRALDVATLLTPAAAVLVVVLVAIPRDYDNAQALDLAATVACVALLGAVLLVIGVLRRISDRHVGLAKFVTGEG